MSDVTENDTKKSRKKLWAVCGVGALAIAVAGGGALTTLYTSITGNDFRAPVPQPYDPDNPEETETKGALLRLTGDPMVYTFDSATYNDLVEGSWTLTNVGEAAAPFDGTLAPVGEMSASLAEALQVEYGQVGAGGEVVAWHHAGTLADSASLAEVLNLGESTIAGGEQLPIAVRVILADPTVLEGTVGEELQVRATFTVSYLDPLDRGEV